MEEIRADVSVAKDILVPAPRVEKTRKKEKLRIDKEPPDIGLAALAVSHEYPVRIMELRAPLENVFNGLRVPLDPPRRAIDWMLKRAADISSISILREPVDAFMDVVDQAVISTIRKARQIYRSRKARREESAAQMLGAHEWPIWLAVKSVGRGGWIYQGLGTIIDRMGGEGKYPAQIGTFARKLREVWHTRIERDKELDRSTSKTRYPVEARLNEKDEATLGIYEKKGHDPKLVTLAKVVDVQIRIVEEAGEVFKYLYKRRFKTDFYPFADKGDEREIHRATEKEINLVLQDFYDLDKQTITKILLTKDGVVQSSADYERKFAETAARVFNKEDYLTFFTHSIQERGIGIINLNADGYFGYKYKGNRYMVQYHWAGSGRTLSFYEILLEMERNKAMVDAATTGTDTAPARRDINSAFIALQDDNATLLDKNKLYAYFKKRVRKGVSDKAIDELVAEVDAWQKTDFYVSVDAMDDKVFGFNPANCEMDNGFGKAVQWDVSRRNGKLAVNQKNIHKIADAGHVKESLNNLLDIAFNDLAREDEVARVPVSPFRPNLAVRRLHIFAKINERLIPTVSKRLKFGWVGYEGTIFEPVSDYPREAFVEETLTAAVIKGFEKKEEEFGRALTATLEMQVSAEDRRTDALLQNLDAVHIKRKLEQTLLKKFQLEIDESARAKFDEVWTAQDQAALAAMSTTEMYQYEKKVHDLVRKRVEAEFKEKILREFDHYSYLWKLYEIDTRDKLIKLEEEKVRKGQSTYNSGVRIAGRRVLQREKLKFFADGIKILTKEIISGPKDGESAIARAYKQMHLGAPTANTVNITSRLLAQAQNGVTRDMPPQEQEGGDMPVERLLVQLPASERLEISTVTGDKFLVAAAVDCFESLNRQDVNFAEITADWKALVQRIEVNAGIVAEAEIYWSIKMLSNTALITAGSGDMRELLLNWMTKVINKAVNVQYHSRGMSSWINKKDPSSRFSRFSTALVEDTENVEGDVYDGENLEISYRMTTERFKTKAETETGVRFEDAATEKRKIIISRMQELAQEEVDRFTKMKLFTFTMMGLTEPELEEYHAVWNRAVRACVEPELAEDKPSAQALLSSYHNSFLNYVIWSRARMRGIMKQEILPTLKRDDLGLYVEKWTDFDVAERSKFDNNFDNYCVWMKSWETGDFAKLMAHYDFSNMKFVY